MRSIKSDFLRTMLVASMILLAGCHGKPEQVDTAAYCVNIDSAEVVDILPMSSLFKSGKIVCSLDTASAAMLGAIDKMEICGDYVIAMDRDVRHQLCVFDRNGKFLHAIGAKGNGKGEHADLLDFTCDSGEGLIYILDGKGGKIHSYSISEGEYKKSVDCSNEYVNIKYAQSCLYCYHPSLNIGEAHAARFLLDRIEPSDGKILEQYLTSGYNKGSCHPLMFNGSAFLGTESGTFRLALIFANQVMALDKDGKVYPYLTLNSRNWVSEDDLKEFGFRSDHKSLAVLFSRRKALGMSDFMESEKYILLSYMQGFSRSHILYDKAKECAFVVRRLTDDLLGSKVDFGSMNLQYAGSDGKGVYFFLSPGDMDSMNNQLWNEPPFSRLHVADDAFNGAVFYYEFI